MFSVYINPEKAPAALQSKANGTPLSALRIKRGATVPIRFVLLGVSEASNLRMGVKNKGGYEEELLLFASATEGESTDEGLSFVLNLEVNSVQLDAALQVGSGVENAPATLAAITEISWMENDTQRITDTLTTTIVNDIIRLASSPPSTSDAEYPAPSQLATKAWVQNLKASAAQYGLVLLEADAVIESEDHTSVALTQDGTLAIPAATFATRGTVRLGTSSPITGSGVLLVGETPNGRLAVSAEGISAYALAVEKGFRGSEEQWLESLKGDGAPLTEGQEKALNDAATHQADKQIHVSDEDRKAWDSKLNSNVLTQEKTRILGGSAERATVTYVTLPAHLLPKGNLLTLTLSVPDANIPSGVDSEHELHAVLSLETDTRTYEWLATSTDTHLVSRASVLTWHFDRVPIDSTATLRLNFIRAENVSHDPTDSEGNSAVYAKLDVAQDATQGECYSGGMWKTWLPEVILTYEADKYAESDTLNLHTENTEIHLSSKERAALTELLANKEALLALLNI